MTSIDEPKPAENHDNAIRYQVPSESNPHETYLVELDSYSGNGECACDHFNCRLRPLLALRYTPERAIAEGKVKVKSGQRIADSLRCKHILNARQKFTDDVIKEVAHVEKKNSASEKR